MDEKLKAILANIQSLIDQAKQMSGVEKAAGGPEGDDGHTEPDGDEGLDGLDIEKVLKVLKEMAIDPQGSVKKTDGEPDEDDKVNKAAEPDEDDVKKSDEGTHANDKATAVIDDQGEVNEKNIQEVAKAVMKAIQQKKAMKSVNPAVQKSLDTLSAENRELRKSMEMLLEGFGIAKTIKDTAIAKAQTSAKPTEDMNAVRKSLVDEIKSAMTPQTPASTGWGMDTMNQGNSSIRKSLADGISSLVTPRN